MFESNKRPDWTKRTVAEELVRTAPGQQAQVRVFLGAGVTPERIASLAGELVDAAQREVPENTPPPVVGRPSSLANSFALTADTRVILALSAHPQVASILPDNMPDILIRPRPSSGAKGDW